MTILFTLLLLLGFIAMLVAKLSPPRMPEWPAWLCWAFACVIWAYGNTTL